MLINVTQEDIDFGKIHPCHCPVALAIQRQIPEATFVTVVSRVVQVIIFGYVCTFDTDQQTRNFILNFDEGNYVESGEYYAQPWGVKKL